MSHNIHIPEAQHGRRIIISVIDELAKQEPGSPWVSVPQDENDLSRGYKDITYGDLANAVNHATHWLRGNLSLSEAFQPFVYNGPRDLRYPIFAAAAAKLEKVVSNTWA